MEGRDNLYRLFHPENGRVKRNKRKFSFPLDPVLLSPPITNLPAHLNILNFVTHGPVNKSCTNTTASQTPTFCLPSSSLETHLFHPFSLVPTVLITTKHLHLPHGQRKRRHYLLISALANKDSKLLQEGDCLFPTLENWRIPCRFVIYASMDISVSFAYNFYIMVHIEQWQQCFHNRIYSIARIRRKVLPVYLMMWNNFSWFRTLLYNSPLSLWQQQMACLDNCNCSKACSSGYCPSVRFRHLYQ